MTAISTQLPYTLQAVVCQEYRLPKWGWENHTPSQTPGFFHIKKPQDESLMDAFVVPPSRKTDTALATLGLVHESMQAAYQILHWWTITTTNNFEAYPKTRFYLLRDGAVIIPHKITLKKKAASPTLPIYTHPHALNSAHQTLEALERIQQDMRLVLAKHPYISLMFDDRLNSP